MQCNKKLLTILIASLFIGCAGDKGEKGDRGDQGPQGQPGETVQVSVSDLEIVDPCGDNPNLLDTVLLKDSVTNKNYIIKLSGNKVSLQKLNPGTYRTADDSCEFTINSNGDITNESYE